MNIHKFEIYGARNDSWTVASMENIWSMTCDTLNQCKNEARNYLIKIGIEKGEIDIFSPKYPKIVKIRAKNY